MIYCHDSIYDYYSTSKDEKNTSYASYLNGNLYWLINHIEKG